MTNTELDQLEKNLESVKNGWPATCVAIYPLIADARLLNELVAVLQDHCGERGDSEGAVDTLRRIIRERDTSLEHLTNLKFYIGPPGG